MVLSRKNIMISAIRSFFTSIWFCPTKLYDLMNSPPNFSLSASTRGLVHGSCCGPFGLGGAAGAAGFAPGGCGGGLGTAAFGSPGGAGFGGSGFGASAFGASDFGGSAAGLSAGLSG